VTFLEIFRFEVRYQARRASTWLYVAVLLALSVYPTLELSATYARNDGSAAHSPFIVAVMGLLWGTFGLFMASAVTGEAAARDAQTRMDSLVYTAPVGKTAYFGGRFLAAFGVSAAILLAAPIGLALGGLLLSRTPLGAPFNAVTYLSTYGLLLLPNAFVAAALMFSLAALTRRAVASYVGVVLLACVSAFSWTIVATTWKQWGLARLLDPFGAVILGELSMVWTPVERSTRSIELQGAMLWNRVLWLTIAAGVLAATCRRFRFRHHAAGPAPRMLSDLGPPTVRDAEPRSSRATASAQVSFGFATHARQIVEVGCESFLTVVRGWGGVLLVATAAFIVFSGTPTGHLGVPMFPTAERMVRFLAAPLARPDELNSMIVPLLIIFWAGELIWRDRETRQNHVIDVVPAPDWVLFLGRAAGLGVVLITLQALVMVGGIGTQLQSGYFDIQIAPYLQSLLGLQLADYLLFSLLALVIHVLVNQKYVGHLGGLLAYAFIVNAPVLGVEHHLLVYGSDPGWSYSGMRRFDPFIGPWLWFKLYWTGWALLLAALATLFYVRGTETTLAARLALATRRFTRGMQGAVVATLALIVAVGAFIFYNTNILNAYVATADGIARRVDYEKRYGRYRNVPQPQLTGTTLRVEIHSARRAIDIRGVFEMVNATDVAVDTIHLAPTRAVRTTGIRFDRPVIELVADDRLGHRIYTLSTPLAPGDSLRLEFELRFEASGFSNGGLDSSVVSNGAYFTNGAWLPGIGYQPEREIANAEMRRAHGLAPRPMTRSLDDETVRFDPDRATRVAVDAVVGTDAGQIGVAPGRLRRSWTEKGRRYVHYATDAPIRNDYAFFSAAYAVREARWRPPDGSGREVSIEVYHHPAHAWNVDRMVRSVKASLDYYTRVLGPYPHGQVRLIEHPGDSVTLHASPVNISYQEPFALLNPEKDPRRIDLPFAVVAHEMAHQWWGNALTPAGVEGAGLLTESLAWYSALGVVEQSLGREHLERLLEMMREAYLTPASRGNVPLLRADDPFLAYRKGPFAMYALREYLGADRLDGALRRLLDRHRSGQPPLPTPLDLYRELQAIAPESLRGLLADLFETNTFWELTTQSVGARRLPDGNWRVTLDVLARKVVVDEDGVEKDVPMDDPIEVGVFTGAADSGPGERLYLETHRVRSGRQRITVTTPREPARAGIDPRRLLIDINGRDNLKELDQVRVVAVVHSRTRDSRTRAMPGE
jgi:ABC-2 type transport system permease protein